MELLLISAVLWSLNIYYAIKSKLPLTSERILKIRQRISVGYLAIMSAFISCAAAVMMLIIALFPMPLPSGFGGLERVEILGAALAMSAAAFFFWNWKRTGDLVVTKQGLHFFSTFICWKEVSKVEAVRVGINIFTPGKRRSWNGWRGITLLPRYIWEVTPEEVDRLQECWLRFGRRP